MRFTIAAGILASTLPSKLQNSGFADAREYKRELWKSLAQPTQSELGANVQQAVAVRRLGRRKTGGLLKNLGTKIANAGPSKSICDPDVGLLACGFGHYCESSQESPLGGVCVPIPESMQRELQTNETDASPSDSPTASPVAASTTDSPTASPTNFTAIASGPGVYCDPDSPFYGRLECDCEQWSAQNQTGTIECKLVPAACFPECEDTCYSVNFTYYTDGIKSSAYTYCYDFYKPFEQTFCFGYANDRTCAVSLDGEKCNSCYTSYQLNCNYGDCYSQPCSNFDCENIGLGTGNSCIDMVAPPVFDDCYRQVAGLYPSCSLCADNVILFPEAEFDLPGYGLFNCSYIADLASYGVLNPQQCTYATVLAGPVCCESGGASAFVCDLCKDSTNVITTSDAMVSIPSQPSVSCGDLLEAAKQGVIAESQCGIVQGFTDKTCGCMSPDDITPTASPGGVPTSDGGATPTSDGGPTADSAGGASAATSTLPSVLAVVATVIVAFWTK